MSALKTHGMSKHQLYAVWFSMKARCSNPKNQAWKLYGGRGIGLTKSWLKFEPFRDWALAKGWKPGLTLERRDNNAGYSPSNCYFATWKQQGRNRRDNKLDAEKVAYIRQVVKFGGRGSQRKMAALFGVSPSCIGKIARKERWV